MEPDVRFLRPYQRRSYRARKARLCEQDRDRFHAARQIKARVHVTHLVAFPGVHTPAPEFGAEREKRAVHGVPFLEGLAEQRAGDYLELDLVGAAENALRAGVEVSCRGNFAQFVDLGFFGKVVQRAVRLPADRIGPEYRRREFGDLLANAAALDLHDGGGNGAGITAALYLRHYRQLDHVVGVDVHRDFGQPGHEQRVIDGSATVRSWLLRNLDQFSEVGSQRAASEGAAALEFQQVFCDVPSIAFLTDTVGNGNVDVVEEGLVEFVGAVDREDRADLDAGRLEGDQQERDAFLLLAGIIGANEGEHPIAAMRLRRPDLAAGDDVVVAVAYGF